MRSVQRPPARTGPVVRVVRALRAALAAPTPPSPVLIVRPPADGVWSWTVRLGAAQQGAWALAARMRSLVAWVVQCVGRERAAALCLASLEHWPGGSISLYFALEPPAGGVEVRRVDRGPAPRRETI